MWILFCHEESKEIGMWVERNGGSRWVFAFKMEDIPATVMQWKGKMNGREGSDNCGSRFLGSKEEMTSTAHMRETGFR